MSLFPAWNVLLSYGYSRSSGSPCWGHSVGNRSMGNRRNVSRSRELSAVLRRPDHEGPRLLPCDHGAMGSRRVGASLGYECYVASGELEITYDTGVKVTLQGPAWYEVNGCSGASPWHGSKSSVGEQPDGRSPAPQVVAAPEIASHPSFTLLVPLGVVYKPGGGVQLDGR